MGREAPRWIVAGWCQVAMVAKEVKKKKKRRLCNGWAETDPCASTTLLEEKNRWGTDTAVCFKNKQMVGLRRNLVVLQNLERRTSSVLFWINGSKLHIWTTYRRDKSNRALEEDGRAEVASKQWLELMALAERVQPSQGSVQYLRRIADVQRGTRRWGYAAAALHGLNWEKKKKKQLIGWMPPSPAWNSLLGRFGKINFSVKMTSKPAHTPVANKLTSIFRSSLAFGAEPSQHYLLFKEVKTNNNRDKEASTWFYTFATVCVPIVWSPQTGRFQLTHNLI